MSNIQLRFDGQVAVVTGAGGGLGREYALLLGERGASVVVNDLGGTRSGEGSSVSVADRVVQEIRSKGGKAIADHNSVEDGDKIIKTAIDNFGRIDIVINNAGILRDKSFVKITPEDWDLVHKVHLRGSFLVTRAAWPYFRKQNYGRIIVTASGAGVYGNFGQSNYASAKLGLLGLSNTLAVEGAKYGIHCNTIIPLAGSRLTQDIFPEDWFDQLKPEYISPVVIWLCHKDCPENGGLFEAAGGWVGKYRWQRSLGRVFVGTEEKFTPESVRDNWLEVTNMTEATNPANIQEHTSLLVEALSGGAKGKYGEKPSVFSYNHDHAILYALGVGMSTSEPTHLSFLYEGSEEFQVLPTFGTIITMPALLDSTTYRDEISKLNADPTKLLHGEQYIELFEPLPAATTLTSICKVADVLDKGSGAIVVADVDTYNESGVKVMTSQWSLFFVGAGNFGGKRSSDKIKDIAQIPARKPDVTFQEKTSINQSALYRLCGDKNPLHIDPSFAAMGGFSQPIMHGLCVYGYAARHVLKHFANNDTKKFKSMKARFSGPIIPGNTIQTDMWREGNRIVFRCQDMETGKEILSGGYIDLEEVSIPAHTSAQVPQTEAPQGSGLMSDLVFSEMGRRLATMPEVTAKAQAIFEWNITKDGKPVAQWILDLKNGAGSVYPGPIKTGKPNTTLTLDDQDMLAMVTGKLDPRKAFMSGKLKIKGNIMLTQKLASILSAKGPASGPKAEKKLEAEQTNQATPVKSDEIFISYEKSLERNPHFMEIQNVYLWKIMKDGKLATQWTMDMKNGKGAVYRGPPKIGKADCTITLEDDVMMAISLGKMDPQKAFMSGKLRISGNVLASEKLNELREDTLQRRKNDSEQQAMGMPEDSSSGEEPPICVKSDIIFKLFAERLEEEPEIAQKMKVLYHWNVLRDGKKMCEWTVDLKTGTGAIYKGPPNQNQKADVILTLEDEDTIKLMTSKLNPQRAFMTGKLKIKGNIMLTQKLNQLWQEIIKSGRVVELPLLEPILSDKPLEKDLYSEYAFLELTKKLSRHPTVVDKVQAVFLWNITKHSKPVSQWTLEMKQQPGSVYRGEPKGKQADCVITIDDQDFNQMVLGRYPAEQVLCKEGRAKVTGNASAAEKLAQLFKLSSKL